MSEATVTATAPAAAPAAAAPPADTMLATPATEQVAPTTEQAAPATEQEAPAADDGDAKAPEGAPEAYDFKAPEGLQFDSEVVNRFSEVAKELNLSQDSAQKVLDKMAPALIERQQAQLEQAKNDWATAAKSDKEYGGDKLAENLGLAQKALQEFGTPELQDLLNASGLGNHPEVIRAFVRVGKATSADTFVKGSQKTEPKPAHTVLYDKS